MRSPPLLRPPSCLGAPLVVRACSVQAAKVMGDTCFPSHLPTSSSVAGRGWSVSTPSLNTILQCSVVFFFLFASSKEKKNWTLEVKRPSLYIRAGKLISKAIAEECAPLWREKKVSVPLLSFVWTTRFSAKLRPQSRATFCHQDKTDLLQKLAGDTQTLGKACPLVEGEAKASPAEF